MIFVNYFLIIACTLITIYGASVVNLQKRIVNGDPAPAKLPWLVSLQSSSRSHFCGGNLIQENIVLTGT